MEWKFASWFKQYGIRGTPKNVLYSHQYSLCILCGTVKEFLLSTLCPAPPCNLRWWSQESESKNKWMASAFLAGYAAAKYRRKFWISIIYKLIHVLWYTCQMPERWYKACKWIRSQKYLSSSCTNKISASLRESCPGAYTSLGQWHTASCKPLRCTSNALNNSHQHVYIIWDNL